MALQVCGDDFDLDPPLEFCPPRWFGMENRPKRRQGVICWHHNSVCEEVESDLRRLRRQSRQPPQTPEEEEVEEESIRLKKNSEVERRHLVASNILELEYKRQLEQEEEERKKMKYKRKRHSERLEAQRQKQHDKMAKEAEERYLELKDELAKCRLTDYERALAQGHIKEWTFEEGHEYDLSRLLSYSASAAVSRTRSSTHRVRDYLVKNNGDRVNIDQLRGKHVLPYFWSLSDDPERTPHRADPELNADLDEI